MNRLSPDTGELRSQLSLFIRVATSLRRQNPRDIGKVLAVEQEINLLRQALSFPTHQPLVDHTRTNPDTDVDPGGSMTYQKAGQAALDVQNAVNLSGVVRSFHEALSAVWDEAHNLGKGTDWVNQHPISVLFADKIRDLARLQAADYHQMTIAVEQIARRSREAA